MARLRRFEDHRYVGTRDDMLVYDTDDAGQADMLAVRVAEENLLDRALLQTFAPDEGAEARNRGFRPVVSG
jgi:hypothetical protein